MSNWFYAANGQQQGPFGDAQLRDLITNGTVRADTLVWTEGMAGWQRAAEVPGLMASAGGPPVLPMGGSPPMMGAGGGPGHALTADLPVWGLLGRSIVYIIGMVFVIPAPWVATWFYRWFASCMRVPGRPNFSFTGQPMDIWWVFVLLGLSNYIGVYDNTYQLIGFILQAVLGWFVVRW